MKLSIITINLNNANGLNQTLQSVAIQIWKDFEHIVIDGASIDHSLDVIKSFPHLTCYVSEPDNGVYEAMNKGIIQAKGEYCLFLNSGDYLANETVLAEILTHLHGEDIIYGELLLKSIHGEISKLICPAEITLNRMIFGSIPHPASFIRTNLLKQLGLYRTDLQIVSDWAFFVEAIFKHGASYKNVSIFVTVFSLDGISSKSEYKEIEKEERRIVWNDLFPYLHKEIFRLVEQEVLLTKVFQIPGIKLLMKYVHPIYKKLRYNES